jgi:hypothetical protein
MQEVRGIHHCASTVRNGELYVVGHFILQVQPTARILPTQVFWRHERFHDV